jgi:hypothetical protein
MDSYGIPLHRVRITRRPELVYHPIVVIQYALAHWDLAQDGVSEAEAVFLRCARWLEENAAEDSRKRFLTWFYTFPRRTPHAVPPWISGMAQGQALSVLSRAFQVTGSRQTAAVASRAAKGFQYTVEDGGLITRDAGGNSFIEEFAVQPAIHVLNGCLYGFAGLFEHNSLFPDPAIAAVLDSCVHGINRLLPAFDTGCWSKYSLGIRWNLASRYYHRVHIGQLRYLGHLLGQQAFVARAERFSQYEMSPLHRIRYHLCAPVQTNVNRAMTVPGLDLVKYRDTIGWDQ